MGGGREGRQGGQERVIRMMMVRHAVNHLTVTGLITSRGEEGVSGGGQEHCFGLPGKVVGRGPRVVFWLLEGEGKEGAVEGFQAGVEKRLTMSMHILTRKETTRPDPPCLPKPSHLPFPLSPYAFQRTLEVGDGTTRWQYKTFQP